MTSRFSRAVGLMDARGPRSIVACVVALALWSIFIDCFVGGLSQQPDPVRPLTLDARIVQLTPPPPPPSPHPSPRPPTATPAAQPLARAATAPVRPPPAPRRTVPRTSPLAAALPAPLPPRDDDIPADRPTPSPSTALQALSTTHAGGGETSNAPSSTGPSTGSSTSTGSAASGNGTAHPILQPLPVLPDDLREYAYQAVALARFFIHPDGSVDVTLVRPTQNPRLNQLLLEALRKWRFFPAMKGGHPVESEQDIRVHFNVD